MRQLLKLVEKRLGTSGTAAIGLEKDIDRIVADCYGLSAQQRRALGASE